ncbi:MAG TPA: trehalase family glycosidase [Longimicrobiales bacterium]|nr:trehalase family glycosidase [Longimicrobiales bacterium]
MTTAKGVGLLLGSVLWACAAPGHRADAFTDVLDVTGVPDSARDERVFAFSDQGAWHMFGLPDVTAGDPVGGFTGPFLLTDGGVWLGRSLAGLAVWQEGQEQPLAWGAGPDAVVSALPGRLHQEMSAGVVDATLDLVFASGRSALVRATVANRSAQVVTLAPGWVGDAALSPARIMPDEDGVQIRVEGSSTVVDLQLPQNRTWEAAVGSEGSFELRMSPVVLDPGAAITEYLLVSAYESATAMEGDRARRGRLLADAPVQMDAQAVRWEGYLASALGRLRGDASPIHRRIAVKAVQTLLSNWRSPLGDLRHDGLFPSFAYRGFHGVWSWDSWKHARALALFAPELAEEQMRVMLDWQDGAGMVPDVIYADSTENNWRDTKPPLAAWAVAGIFDATGDTAFVREVYPALVAYHAWWYDNRDHDGDGLCEYGSTDGTRIAAAWESGMDNAVRFDEAVMLENHEGAWSLDQESVDLNAYLYAEKGYLAEMAEALGRADEARAYRVAADKLRTRIRDTMFDEETGYFYDVRMNSGEPIRVQGPEGWIPLWAGVATDEQARRVAAVMMDPEKFFSLVPLPTLSMARSEFDPADGYWRGPVWLDQAYFGVRGLERYGFMDEGDALRARLLDAPAGLTGQGPIFENYDPRTGEGLNAPHFSWSAAHLLMLLDAHDGRRP